MRHWRPLTEVSLSENNPVNVNHITLYVTWAKNLLFTPLNPENGQPNTSKTVINIDPIQSNFT